MLHYRALLRPQESRSVSAIHHLCAGTADFRATAAQEFLLEKRKQLTLCLSCTQNDSPTFYWYS